MNQELNDYIKKARELGQNDEQIKEELLKGGWGVDEVDSLLKPSSVERTETGTKTYHYYIVKAIAVVGFLYSLWLIFAGSSIVFKLISLSRGGFLTPQQTEQLGAGFLAAGSVLLVALVGIIGFLGLFYFKKWGLYLTLLLLLWFATLGTEGSVVENWPLVLFVAVIAVYLFSQRKASAI